MCILGEVVVPRDNGDSPLWCCIAGEADGDLPQSVARQGVSLVYARRGYFWQQRLALQVLKVFKVGSGPSYLMPEYCKGASLHPRFTRQAPRGWGMARRSRP